MARSRRRNLARRSSSAAAQAVGSASSRPPAFEQQRSMRAASYTCRTSVSTISAMSSGNSTSESLESKVWLRGACPSPSRSRREGARAKRPPLWVLRASTSSTGSRAACARKVLLYWLPSASSAFSHFSGVSSASLVEDTTLRSQASSLSMRRGATEGLPLRLLGAGGVSCGSACTALGLPLVLASEITRRTTLCRCAPPAVMVLPRRPALPAAAIFSRIPLRRRARRRRMVSLPGNLLQTSTSALFLRKNSSVNSRVRTAAV
mmetsp:Transcript_3979/g.9443  ORF Transcript_3979/g.9443 Transcript_3979/m.9443 type:complete len:263 (-) Transcript_3979:1560-2348(-)